MPETPRSTRLSHQDPWATVKEAREQRGPIVARWLVATVALLCSLQFWRARFRTARELSHPEAPGVGLTSTSEF